MQTLMIRAVGPTLAIFGLECLPDPQLTIYRDGQVMPVQANWSNPADRPRLTAMANSMGAFALLANSRDAAVIVTLPPGSYSAVVQGVSGGQGTGMVELYSSGVVGTAFGDGIVNISSRGPVGAADEVVIAGFVIGGAAPRTVLVRGVGTTLTNFGVPGVLNRPKLTLYKGASVVASNGDWKVGTDPVALRRAAIDCGAFPLQETGHDAAMLITLEPGAYTAVITGQNGEMGVALVEIYQAK